MKNLNGQRRDFLKSASAAGLASLIPASSEAKWEHARKEMTNWSGNIVFQPPKIARPHSLPELQDLIRSHSQVKLFGSRHSFNTIAVPENLWLDLRNLSHPIKFDARKMTIELPGAMTLNEANRLLPEYGVAFASLGEIDEQTMAGLTATATHGTGMDWGTISDSVRAMKLVTANGELLEISSGDELAAVRTHLGALGAVVSVTMDVVPKHQLERHQRFMPIDAAVDPDFIRANAHTQIYYLPFADQTYVKTLNFSTEPSRGIRKKRLEEKYKENLLFDASLAAVSHKPSLVPRLLKTIAKQFGDVNDVGPSPEMMVTVRTMKYHEMELAMDLKDARDILEVVRETISELATQKTDRFFAHLPVTIRSVKGCPDNLLSPTLGRDTVYFSFISHPSFSGYESYFKTIEEKLVPRFDARPHWGKRYLINPVKKYDGFAKFQTLRKQLDPEGKFLNPYLRNLFE